MLNSFNRSQVNLSNLLHVVGMVGNINLQFSVCVNSPSSVTVSGDASAIDELEKVLRDRQLFNRKFPNTEEKNETFADGKC
jgi:acyl transferase domain-containing protein